MSSKNQKEYDRFIAIAAGGKGMNGEIKRLDELEPLKINHIDIEKCAPANFDYPVFNEEEAYKNFLLEKESVKEKFRPFLRKYSSEINTPVKKTQLTEFLYRRETEEDKKDFSLVLNKKGEFEKITLPYYWGPEGRYASFFVTDLNFSKVDENKAYVLNFEAVDYEAEVYINGRLAGSHVNFFAPFKVDISSYIHEGANTLVVVVKNDYHTTGVYVDGFRTFGDKIYGATSFGYDEPKLGWHHCPAGSGIVGTVELVESNKIKITDIFVRPNIDDGKITVNTTVFNFGELGPKLKVLYTLEGKNFKQTIFENIEDTTNRIAVSTNYLVKEFKLDDFKLWTLDEPYLYDIKVTLISPDGDVIDEEQTHFGMRKFHMDENSTPKGKFYFNNERIVLRGANEMGHLPRAVMENNDEQLLDDIAIAKVANMNFYRMTQRPVFKKIYDYFDMTGMLCQTDFPLFSYLKPNLVGTALKQVQEMELLTRNHPSVVVETFCNETLDKTCWGHEQYNLSRRDFEKFFNAGKEVIEVFNPDRVLKFNEGDYAPILETTGISDFHCYTYWYISHGIEAGRLNKGYLPPMRKDWMTSCGEYGADGLDSLELMKKYCPKDWYPETDTETWSPANIATGQCYVLHGGFFPEQENARDWIRESRKHQVMATKELTYALRRRADYIESSAIHLLIDCWPCGWTKTLVDVDRIPKPAYYTYKECLIPLRVNLRRDRYTLYSGEKLVTEVYALNDYGKDYELKVDVKVVANGKVVQGHKKTAIANLANATYFGDVVYDIPTDFVGTIEVLSKAKGIETSYDKVEFRVLPRIEKSKVTPLVLGDSVQDILKVCGGEIDKNTVITDVAYFTDHQEELEKFAFDGGRLFVFTNRPLNILGQDVIFKINTLPEEVGANVWINRSETHRYTKEFDVMDFNNFYNNDMGYQDLTNWFKFDWEDSEEILYTYEYTGEEQYKLHKKHKMVMAERKYGKGTVTLSTLSCIKGCIGYNPILDKFITNLINNEGK